MGDAQSVPELIVPFKRQLYIDVLSEFREHCIAEREAC